MDESVLIVGGGAMGAGIAFVAARAGCDVGLVEPDDAARERALDRIASSARRAGDETIAGRVTALSEIPQTSGAGIAIEAVPEHFELKSSVFARLSEVLAANALLATNTSSFSVSELAEAATEPQRVVGLHFFNPPAAMPLVEVIRGDETSGETLDRALAFAKRLGKTPVVALDSPGFIVNRVARPYYLQAMRAYEAGVASMEDIDGLARAAGFRMGPFELMDFIGLDVNLAVSDSVYAQTELERLQPVELQRQLVAAGRLGRKTGRGFYDYRNGSPERIDLDVDDAVEDMGEHEVVAIVGFGRVADELAELLSANVSALQRIENDDLIDELDPQTTIVIDTGDGFSDRRDLLTQLESRVLEECVVFADAYATDIAACAGRFKHPDRLVGYGIVGAPSAQRAVEIVDSDNASDDSLRLAQELFATAGKGFALVSDRPGLFVGRTIASIVNEAVCAVEEGVADAEDVDTAMVLGTNYPLGPIAWGRDIGGRRIERILQRLAEAEGAEYAPHRALWVLDLEPPSEETDAGTTEPTAPVPGIF